MTVALRLFANANYGDISVDQIAKAAKCSHGLFYHYFPAKEDMFEALLKEQVLPSEAIPDYGRYLALPAKEGFAEFCKHLASLRTYTPRNLYVIRIYMLYPLDRALTKYFPKFVKDHSLETFLKKMMAKLRQEGVLVNGNEGELATIATILTIRLVQEPSVYRGDVLYSLFVKE